MSGGDHLPKLSMSSSSTFGGSSGSVNNGTGASAALATAKYQPANMHTTGTLGAALATATTTTTSLSLSNQRYVKLNVGGRLFSTSIDTLTRQDNMLRAMFSGRLDVITDLDGYILIDRSGKHFEFVLNYLRDEDAQCVHMHLSDKSECELYEMLKEAKFYCIQPLVSLIEQKILINKALSSPDPYYGSSVVSMVTSKSDLTKILNSTDKPCIRLLINRHNNKYSYTNTSDDNLLKNIELFERMAIKFKNRIMFIKDTTSNEEICCWYFHGGGKKIAEVCCTSIVYTTEKKQTKVEFPDSKILEEIFVNAVLFESKETAAANNNNMDCQSSTSQINFQNGALVDEDAYDADNMPRISLGSQNNPATVAATTATTTGSNSQTSANTNPVVVGYNSQTTAAALSNMNLSSGVNTVSMNSMNATTGAISTVGASANTNLANSNNLVTLSSSVLNTSNVVSMGSNRRVVR